jgi:hypothetical protein
MKQAHTDVTLEILYCGVCHALARHAKILAEHARNWSLAIFGEGDVAGVSFFGSLWSKCWL